MTSRTGPQEAGKVIGAGGTVALALMATSMGYRDAMSTSAPPADPRNEDSIKLHRLLEEQAALRRVATLVASGGAENTDMPAPPKPAFVRLSRERSSLRYE